MKIKIFLFIFIFLILFSVVSAKLVIGEYSEGISIKEVVGGTQIKFMAEDAKLIILEGEDNPTVKAVYTNIKPTSQASSASIYFLLSEEIEKIDITASKDTKIYINGLVINLKKGLRLTLERGDLRILSPEGKFAFDYAPEFLNANLPGAPKTITYVADPLSNIEFPNGYILDKGIVKYSLGNKEYYVPQGEISSLNNYQINAEKTKVVIGENFKLNGEKLYLTGKGFDVSFNSPELKISLDEAKNKKYFNIGDEGKSVENIQKITGSPSTGKYDLVTKEYVKKWQRNNNLDDDGLPGKDFIEKISNPASLDFSKSKNGKYFSYGDTGDSVKEIQSFLVSKGYLLSYTASGKTNVDGIFLSRTKEALERWQGDNDNLVVDGKFGKNAAKAFESSKKNVEVYMLGGSAEITNKKTSLDIFLDEETMVNLANKKYYFDGKSIHQKLSNSLKSSSVQVPTKITFNNGFWSDDVVELIPNQREIGRIEMRDFVISQGVNPSESVCSSFTTYACPLIIEGEEFLEANSKELISTVRDMGIYGPAWKMSSNIVGEDGKRIYDKNVFLDTTAQIKLEKLKTKIKKESLEMKNKGTPKETIRKILSKKYRVQIGEIYNDNKVSMPVSLEKGDVLSMYFYKSNYLTAALIEGKDNQANTHVGTIPYSIETTLNLEGGDSVANQIKKQLKINDEGLPVNTYAYFDKGGSLKKANYVEGIFFSEDGTLLPEKIELLVTRPQIAHMIHYTTGEKDPFHVESLDQVLKKEEFTLFGVTRPVSSEYINDVVQTPESYNKMKQEISCVTASCKDMNMEQTLRINGIKDSKEFANAVETSTQERKKEFNIPENKLKEFNHLTLAVIDKESKFGDSISYKIEADPIGRAALTSYKFLKGDDNPGVFSQGYMQVNIGSIKESADFFGEKVPSTEQIYANKDISIKYGQRHLAPIYQTYSNEEPITEKQVKLIAAAYNSGHYTPRNAAIQEQLFKLGYYNKKSDGKWGENTEIALQRFSRENNLEMPEIDEMTFTSKDFENTALYKEIKKKYQEKTGESFDYAVVPDISHITYRTRSLKAEEYSVERHAQNVYQSYKLFCGDC